MLPPPHEACHEANRFEPCAILPPADRDTLSTGANADITERADNLRPDTYNGAPGTIGSGHPQQREMTPRHGNKR